MDGVQPWKVISFYQMALPQPTFALLLNGFMSCGLGPFDNNNIFREEDYAAAELAEEACPVVRDIDHVDVDKPL